MEQTSVDERLESTTDTGSRESKAPLLPGAFPSDSPGSSINEVDTQQEPSSSDGAGKARKRDFWKLGKKSDQDKQETKAIPTSSSPPPTTAQTPSRASASHIATYHRLAAFLPLAKSCLSSAQSSLRSSRITWSWSLLLPSHALTCLVTDI